jgi:mannose-6-phosphate isomerase-like protein (cupin superfamily)
VYYVVEGRGRIRVADEEQSVGAGSVIFVAANVQHHFFEIEETLKVVVFWAPPHHSREDA